MSIYLVFHLMVIIEVPPRQREGLAILDSIELFKYRSTKKISQTNF